MELMIVGFVCFVFTLVPVVLLAVTVSIRNRQRSSLSADERVRCPHCAEWIMPQAIKCRFCGATRE